MNKELYVSSTPHETKVALVEDDQLAEVFFERENEYTLAGSIYKGRVTRVLPGMQSAFVDIGLERDAFLYVSDFLELGDEEDSEEFGEIPAPPTTVNLNRQSPPETEPASPPAETRRLSRPNLLTPTTARHPTRRTKRPKAAELQHLRAKGQGLAMVLAAGVDVAAAEAAAVDATSATRARKPNPSPPRPVKNPRLWPNLPVRLALRRLVMQPWCCPESRSPSTAI